MPLSLARIYLGGNNPPLNEAFKNCLKQNNLEIETHPGKETDYKLLIYDLSNNLENSTETLLNDLDLISGFTGKAAVVLVGYSQSNESAIQPYLNDRKNNLRLIITQDLYHLDGKNNLTQFENQLCEIVSSQKIETTPNGSRKYYPTSLEDLCQLIIKSLFVTSTSGRKFIGLTEEISDLELGYLLKKSLEKKDLSLDINLSLKSKKETENQMEMAIQTQALLNWIPKISFFDALPKIIDRCQVEPDIASPDKTASISVAKKPKLQKLLETKPEIDTNLHIKEKRGIIKIIFISLSIIILLIALPLIISLTSLYFSTKLTYRSFQEIRTGAVKPSLDHLNQARFFQKLSVVTFEPFVSVGNTNNYLLILGHSQTLLGSIIDTYSLGNKLYLGLLGKESVDVRATTAALRVNLISVSEKLSQIQLLFGQTKLPFDASAINLLKSQINLALPLLDLIEKIGANQDLQRYLVVIQDVNELRPSGGFISTYGVLTLDQGKIIDFQVDSSLSLDRLIEGKIEPPAIVKQLLSQSNWSFHDSNLDADFSGSARQLAWFYQRFKNHSLDGVIGLNTHFLRFVLEQTGPIVLSDGQSINPENLASLTSNPTASRGLDVITALTQTLGQKLTSAEISFASFSKAFIKTITFDEVNLWFSSPPLESLAESSRLAGEVKTQICHPQLLPLNCHADTIYLNESNMSVNKLNYYLKRNQNLTAQITDTGLVNYTLNYDYSYPTPTPTDLGSFYKVYYQFYLPTSSQNLTITLDSQPLDSKSLLQTILPGLIKLEFSASLSINQPHRLGIGFTSPNQLDFKKQLIPFTLALLKQPGTLNDLLTVKINYPANLVARSLTTPLKQTSATELTFQTNQTSHQNLGIIFKNTSI